MIQLSKSTALKCLVYRYRLAIIYAIHEYRIANNISPSKTADRKDYPNVITGCEYDKYFSFGRSENSRALGKRGNNILHPMIINELKRIVPSCNPPCCINNGKGKLFLGTCAEDDAASTVLFLSDTKINNNNVLKQIKFIQPYRPRTRQPIDFCDVCENIFG